MAKVNSVTVIISVYKNINALKIILLELEKQTIIPDEVIISEDGECLEMKEFITTLDTSLNLVHTTQEDLGWRKNRALNRAIISSSNEYLIFIDGDVVPHRRFIEGHLFHAKLGRVNAGKRAELGVNFSKKVLNEELTVHEISNKYIRWIKRLHDDKIRHYEDGIYVSPNSIIYKWVIQKKRIHYLIGCNFSCFKVDIESLNGFNEDYIHPSVGEDVDINWRFRAKGIDVISCRNIANVYHLYHKKGFGDTDAHVNNIILRDTIKYNKIICKNGIQKL